MRNIVVTIFMSIAFWVNAEIQFDIFATYPFLISTGQSGEITSNDMIAKLDGNKLYINGNIYTLYDKKTDHDGFLHFETYDAYDKYYQKCFVGFITNDAASTWASKYQIIIKYEGIDKAMVFLYKESKTK